VPLARPCLCDQIVQHFLLHLGPDGVGKHENALHLGFGIEELSASPASDAGSRLRRSFACVRSVGCSQCCAAMMSWGSGRRREKLLVIVLDTLERWCCWLLSEMK